MIPAVEDRDATELTRTQSVPDSIKPKFVFSFLNQLRLVAKFEQQQQKIVVNCPH